MSLTLADVQLTSDWVTKWGRPDAWYGDTHKADGTLLEEAKGKPRVAYARWQPDALKPSDPVEALHITYTDGEVVKVPAEEFRKVAP